MIVFTYFTRTFAPCARATRSTRTALKFAASLLRIARRTRVFGSVSRGDDVEGSDIDLLIDPTANTILFDIGAIRYELLTLLGVRADVLTPQALPKSFRAKLLAEAVPA